MELAETSDLFQEKVDGCKLMVQTSAMMGNNAKGLGYCELMPDNAKKLGDKNQIADSYMGLKMFHQMAGRMDDVIGIMKEAVVFAEEVSDDMRGEIFQAFASMHNERDNDESFMVEQPASQLNYSSRQLERNTKKYTGLTPNKLIREIRLQKAYRIL